jgi:hypothetical protein
MRRAGKAAFTDHLALEVSEPRLPPLAIHGVGLHSYVARVRPNRRAYAELEYLVFRLYERIDILFVSGQCISKMNTRDV